MAGTWWPHNIFLLSKGLEEIGKEHEEAYLGQVGRGNRETRAVGRVGGWKPHKAATES